jgi:hypothetical protein
MDFSNQRRGGGLTAREKHVGARVDHSDHNVRGAKKSLS